jgi:uncharacterized protein YeaO (DUF488 family)
MQTSPNGDFRVQRIYDDPIRDTHRVLVDRLWPRGITKEHAGLDRWVKEVAPSAELRRWYGHKPARFDEFARRYRAELGRPPAAAAIADLRDLARNRTVVLLTATRDVERSGAQVLYDYLRSRSP